MSVLPSVRLHFLNLGKTKKFRVRIVIAADGIVGLAEWISEGTYVL